MWLYLKIIALKDYIKSCKATNETPSSLKDFYDENKEQYKLV